MVVLHVKRVPKCNEGKSWFERRLGGTLFEGRLLSVYPKVSQCPTSVRNEKTYEYIIMDNIQLV